MTTRKLDGDVETVTIDYDDLLRKFELYDDRRPIRSTQVESLLRTLRNGGHFDAPLVVHKDNGNYKIIDGNHRYEALKIFLGENRDDKIELRLLTYKNLTPSDERALYIKYAIGIKQTIDDLLHLMRSEIPLYDMLKRRHIPVTTSSAPASDTISFKLILRMLYGTLNTEKVFTARGLKRDEIISVAKEYGEENADMVKSFLTVFRGAFGSYRENKFLRPVFCVPMFNLFYMNTEFGTEALVERFGNCISDTQILSRLREHNRDALLFVRERMAHVANRGRKKKIQTVGVKLKAESK